MTPGKDRWGPALLKSSGIIDLQNKNNILVAKQWNFRFSVPMQGIAFELNYHFKRHVNYLLKTPPANPKMSLFEKCFKSCFETGTGM